MKTNLTRRLKGVLLLILLICYGSFLMSQGINLIRYDSFEEYSVGTTGLDYWYVQNCGSGPSCGSTCVHQPLVVTNEQARSGAKSLRFQRTNDDKVITGGSYCSARNEIGNWNDAFATYGDHVWFGFSVYIADNHLQDKWSGDNVTIFQFKNVDAGGGGNSYGSLKSYKKDGAYLWYMYGYGDIGPVELNKWIDVVIHLKYGISNDGIIEAWIGDKYISKQNVSFPAKLACYPKFGSYSDVLGSGTPMHKLYFDEIKFGKASDGGDYYADVAPASAVSVNPLPCNGITPVVISASTHDGNLPSNVMDCNFNTRWSAEGQGQTLTFELNDATTMQEVKIAWFSGELRSSMFDIQSSNDGTSWQNILINASSSGTSGELETFSFPAVTAKFLRYVGNGNGVNAWNSITEFEIHETVSVPVAVTGVGISSASLTLEVGATALLSATISPSNASDISVVWSSSNSAVATVSPFGSVTAVSKGTAAIMVTTNDGSFNTACTVTVNDAEVSQVKYIILKADDLWDAGGSSNPGRISDAWKQFFTMVEDKEIKANLGIVGSQSNYTGGEAFWNQVNEKLNSGRYELWNHGNSHVDFTTKTLQWQVDNLRANQTLVQNKTGKTMVAVGMPFNAFNSDTYTALNGMDDIQVIMFGNEANTSKTVFARDLNIESPTLVPDYSLFVGRYPAAVQRALDAGRDYFCLQIHPNSHTPYMGSRQTNLHQIIDFLKAQGHIFVTISEYLMIHNNDTEPPSAPTGLLSKLVTSTGFQLSWNASSDNIGVAGYDVYQDGILKTSVTGTSASISGLSPAISYSFMVKAKDFKGNASEASAPLLLTTREFDEVNLALNKPITASAYQEDANGVFPPSNLVDGIISSESRWAVDGFPQWVEIDLGANSNIARFQLHTFQNRAYQYTIEVKPEGGIYTTIVDRTSNTEQDVLIDEVTANGRYVRINVTAAYGYTGTWVSLSELRVIEAEQAVTPPSIAVTGVELAKEFEQVNKGQTRQLNATVLPFNASNASVTWNSSKTNVATVDANGLVSAVGAGTTTIFVTTNDGNFADSCVVEVKEINTQFVHPGISLNQAELDLIRYEVNAGIQPRKAGWDEMMSAPHSSVNWVSNAPVQILADGATSGGFSNDVLAALSNALQWYITGNQAHATTAINILNDYAYTVQSIITKPGEYSRQRVLVSGWHVQPLCDAAEILRHSGAGWSSADIQQFQNMLYNVFLPEIHYHSSENGNWEASQINSMIAMAVFCDDKVLFDDVINNYILGNGRGAIGVYVYESGECQETCRGGGDPGHVQMGLGELVEACEIAWKQGVDVYNALPDPNSGIPRLAKGLEFIAAQLNGITKSTTCGDREFSGRGLHDMWEKAWNHYGNRMGRTDIPNVLSVTERNRPEGFSWKAMYSWGTLTHSNLNVGIEPVSSVSITDSTVGLHVGQSMTLKYIISPVTAGNKSVYWSSSDETIVSINPSGSLTAVGAGIATITITTDDGGFSDQCTVIVDNLTNLALGKAVTTSSYQNDQDGTFPPENIVDGNSADASRWSASGYPQWVEVDLGASFLISSFEVYTYLNRAYQYTIQVKPEGGTYTTVVDRGSSTHAGPIVDNVEGLTGRYVRLNVTGASGYNGTWISLTQLMVYGEEDNTVAVTGVSLDVTSLSIDMGHSHQLTATVSPSNATAKSVAWYSSDLSVATVDTAGLVNTVSPGNATITVRTDDGAFVATCEVLVTSIVDTFNFSPIDDAYIRGSSTFPNSNNFNTAELTAKNNDPWGGEWTRKSFLKFDLTGLSGNILDATLTLHCKSKEAAATDAIISQVSSNSWSESTITSLNMPAIGPQIATFTPLAGSPNLINLTDFIFTGEYVSFALEALSDANIFWYSKEDVLASLRPVLTVTAEGSLSENLLINGGFEDGITAWNGNNSSISTITSQNQEENASLSVTSRGGNWGGPEQNILNTLLENGPGDYYASAFVKMQSASMTSIVTLKLRVDGSWKYLRMGEAPANTAGWTKVEGTRNISWNGILDQAAIYVEGNSTADFWLDNVWLVKGTSKISSLNSGGSFKSASFSNDMPEQKRDVTIRVYPNPSHGDVYVDISLFQNKAKVQLYDYSGRLLYEKSHEPGIIKIDKAQFIESGLYIITVNDDSDFSVGRIQILR